MQTPINSRDLKLQSTSPRVLGISTNYVNLTCPTQQFKYGTDNAPQPALATVTASLVGSLEGTVDFAITGMNPVPTATGNTININPEHITGDVVTINASLVYQGATYQAVPITLSKIFNQLVAKTTRAIDLLPAYADGSGYTLPAADNYIELYNGIVKLTSGVVYGPSTAQTKNGLTAAVNTTTGLITLTQAAISAWTSSSESFTFSATRGSIAYNTTYTITKAKAGAGGQQIAEVALYKWATAQPSAPTGTSQYTWTTKTHVYSGTDWSTTVPAFDGTVGLKLWKITTAVTGEASVTTLTISFSWGGGTIRQVTTEANELIKTAVPKVYKTALSIPTITGSSRYDWASGTVVANLATSGEPNPVVTPSGWELTQPVPAPGFTLYQAAVSIIDRQSSDVTPIDWTTASITPISYAGSNGAKGADGIIGLSAITAILTNDTHAIPTDSTGTTINFSNSGTDLLIYEGATALTYDGTGTDTGKFTVTATVDGVTAGAASTVVINGATGVRYANLTGASFDKTATGSITFTVTGRRLTVESGQTVGTAFTYTVKQSFTKTPSGVAGEPGAAYWITTSASVIQKNIAGVFNPSTVTFTAKKSVGSTASNYTDGYVKLYRNDSLVNPPANNAKITEYIYTIPAGTTSIRYELYSDSGLTNLLDTETIPVVADGAKGDQGTTGISARRAYIVVPSAVTPANTPATFEPTAEFGYPDSGTWFTTNSNSITWTVAWAATAPNSIAENFTLYQSDGLYNAATQKTTWNPPYISSLKVGNLAAISVNTGGLTISDYIKGGAASSLIAGNGFYVDSNGHIRVGNPSAAQLKFDANGLVISDSAGNNIFTVVSNAQSAASTSADAAIIARDAATTAANNATSLKVQFSVDGTTNWHDAYAVGDLYIRTGSKTAAQADYTWNTATKFVPVKNTDYFDGAPGTVVKVQYSINGSTDWHDTYAAGDLYIRTGSKTAGAADSTYVWQTAAKFVPVKGVDYFDGAPGTTVKVQYSSDNTNWVDTPAANTAYIRTGTKLAGAADSTYVFATGVKFVPQKGVEYDDGDPGLSSYIHIKYSNDGGTTFTANSGEAVGDWLGSYVDTTVDDSTSVSSYTWVKIKGNPGADSTVPGPTGPGGPRGSLQGYGSKYSITSNSWSDNLGYQIIYNMLEGDAGTAGITKAQLEAAGWFMQIGDMVTITNSAQTNSFTRFWDGSAWTDPQVIINGNLIATGSITAAKINTRGLDIQDANGNVIFSSGGSALSGLGSNLLRSSGFEDGIAGYFSSFNNFPVTTPARTLPTLGWNLSADYSVRNQGLAYIRVADSVVNSGEVFDFRDNRFIPVVSGTRYEAHALLNTHRCSGYVLITWWTSAQTYISETAGTVVNFASAVYDLSDLRQSGVFATAPATAKFCTVQVRGAGNGSSNPYVFIKNMYFGQAFQAQTTHTPWSPGRSVGQITEGNASAFIGANTVSTTMITDLAVNNAKIANASIQSAKIATIDADLINTGVLRAGRIDVTKLIGSSTSFTTGSGTFIVPAGQTRLAINMRAAGGGGGGGNYEQPVGDGSGTF